MASRSPILQQLLQRCSKPSTRPTTHNPILSSWRHFASRPAPRTRTARPPTSEASKVQPGRASQSGPKFGQLARKVSKYGDLVLYRSPSHTLYRLNAYTITAGAFAYAAYHSYITFVDPLIEIQPWIKYLYGGLSVIVTGMGVAFFVRTGNLVKSVVAVQDGTQTLLRFTVQGSRPFSRPREFDVSPRKVQISKRLVMSESRRQVVGENNRKKITADDVKPNLMMAPIHAMNRGIGSWLQGLRQLVSQEDFIILKVEEDKGAVELRMDANGYLSTDFFLVGDPVEFKD